MPDIHRLPDSVRIEQEAADWIARLNADDASDEDRARFAVWRAAQPSHARVYDSMAGTWQAFSAAGSVVRAVAFGESMNQAARADRSQWRWWVAGIATAALLVAATVLPLYPQHVRPEWSAHAVATLRRTAGETRRPGAPARLAAPFPGSPRGAPPGREEK